MYVNGAEAGRVRVSLTIKPGAQRAAVVVAQASTIVTAAAIVTAGWLHAFGGPANDGNPSLMFKTQCLIA